MEKEQKKAVQSTTEIIESLAQKMKDISSDDIKEIIKKENSAALGLIVCCTSTPANKDKKKKNKK